MVGDLFWGDTEEVFRQPANNVAKSFGLSFVPDEQQTLVLNHVRIRNLISVGKMSTDFALSLTPEQAGHINSLGVWAVIYTGILSLEKAANLTDDQVKVLNVKGIKKALGYDFYFYDGRGYYGLEANPGGRKYIAQKCGKGLNIEDVLSLRPKQAEIFNDDNLCSLVLSGNLSVPIAASLDDSQREILSRSNVKAAVSFGIITVDQAFKFFSGAEKKVDEPDMFTIIAENVARKTRGFNPNIWFLMADDCAPKNRMTFPALKSLSLRDMEVAGKLHEYLFHGYVRFRDVQGLSDAEIEKVQKIDRSLLKAGIVEVADVAKFSEEQMELHKILCGELLRGIISPGDVNKFNAHEAKALRRLAKAVGPDKNFLEVIGTTPLGASGWNETAVGAVEYNHREILAGRITVKEVLERAFSERPSGKATEATNGGAVDPTITKKL